MTVQTLPAVEPIPDEHFMADEDISPDHDYCPASDGDHMHVYSDSDERGAFWDCEDCGYGERV